MLYDHPSSLLNRGQNMSLNSINYKNFSVGNLTFALRNFTVDDLISYSKPVTCFGKIIRAIKLFFSFKGVMTQNDLNHILQYVQNHSLLNKDQNLLTVLNIHNIALQNIIKTPENANEAQQVSDAQARSIKSLSETDEKNEKEILKKIENTIEKPKEKSHCSNAINASSIPPNEKLVDEESESHKVEDKTNINTQEEASHQEASQPVSVVDLTASTENNLIQMNESIPVTTEPSLESKTVDEVAIETKIEIKNHRLKPIDRKKGRTTGQDLFNYYVMYEPRKYLQAKRCVNNKVQQEKDRPSPINAEGWHINDSKLDDDKFLADLIQTFLNVFPIKGEERLKIAEFIQHQVKIKLDENSLLAEQGRYTKAGAMNFVLARARGNYEGTKLVYLMSEEELDRHEKLIEEGQRIFEAFEETYALASEKSKQIVKEVAQEALKTAETKLDKKAFDREHQWDYTQHKLIEHKWDEEIDGKFFQNRDVELRPATRDLQICAIHHFVESFFEENEIEAVSAYIVNLLTSAHKQFYIHYDAGFDRPNEIKKFFNRFIENI